MDGLAQSLVQAHPLRYGAPEYRTIAWNLAEVACRFDLARAAASVRREAREAFRSITDPASPAGAGLRGITQEFSLLNTSADSFGTKLKNVGLKMLDMVWQAALMKFALAPLLNMLGLGGLITALPVPGKPPGMAGGGLVRGPGGSKEDRIPTMLSDREFVVNAESTRKHQPLLEAINAGRVPAMASGGMVSAVRSSIAPASTPGGSTPTVAVSFGDINLNATGGTPAQNADLAAKINEQFKVTARQMMGEELMRQIKPGGMLHR